MRPELCSFLLLRSRVKRKEEEEEEAESKEKRKKKKEEEAEEEEEKGAAADTGPLMKHLSFCSQHLTSLSHSSPSSGYYLCSVSLQRPGRAITEKPMDTPNLHVTPVMNMPS